MHSYELEPLRGVGPIRLGMTRAESRDAMALPVESYRKTPTATRLTDAYLESSFQVYFDDDDRVEFIELSAGGPCIALFRGVRVLELPADEVVALLSQHATPEADEDATSVTFPALELSLWRPFAPDDDGDDPFDNDEDWGEDIEPVEPEESNGEGTTFETVGIGRRGYFSDAAD